MKAGPRIRLVGYVLGIAGAALLTALIVREGAAKIMAALAQASWAFPVIATIATGWIFSDGAAWAALFPRPNRPRILVAVWIRWVGGSVNGILPSARLGGDVLTTRLAAISGGVSTTLATGVIVVNMTLSITLRILFTVGALLVIAGTTGRQHLYFPICGTGLTGLLAVLAFYFIQRLGPFRLITGLTSRVKSFSKLNSVIKGGATFDQTLRTLYTRRWALLVYSLLWIISFLIMSLEIWIALFALGVHASFMIAGIVEIVGQGVRTVLFIVPAGLGVFEGGMVVVCGLLGIPGDIALALSLIRRGREALFTVPGLIVWQIIEARRVLRRVGEAAPS
jgi:glycosyltransferase 2 family protein